MAAKKEYRVIEIMNLYELIINYGQKDGSEAGQKVRIIERGTEVIDPANGQLIGTLDSIKVTLEVAVVYLNFSICRKYQRSMPILSPLSTLMTSSIGEEVKKVSLNVDETQITNKSLHFGDKIKVNDIAELC